MRPGERVGIVGLGHIGGSLAAALGTSREVVAYDLDPGVREIASSLLPAEILPSLEEVVLCAGSIVVATPTPSVGSTIGEIDRLSGTCGRAPLVMEVASVKRPFAEVITDLHSARYIGLHPMAGREGSGIESADGAIFAGSRWAILLDGAEADWDVAAAATLAFAAGASAVIGMRVELHDRVVALTSHLPHALAYALARSASESPLFPLARWMVAGSFRDATRVALSAASRVAEMLEPNRVELEEELDRFIACLEGLREAVARGDSKGWLEQAGDGASAPSATARVSGAQPIGSGELAACLLTLGESGVAVTAIVANPAGGFELDSASL